MAERIDMSAFEGQFNHEERYSRLMPNEDFERLAFLNNRIDDIDDVTDYRKDSSEDLEKTQWRINQVLAAVRKLEMDLLNKRRPVDEAVAINDRAIRQDKLSRAALNRERQRLLEELAARERMFALREAIDRSTENKPWRVGVEVNGEIKKAYPHQLEGAQRLVGAERALLCDQPGLGKTLQAIMTIDMLRAQGKGQKVLIFTPKSVIPDFERAFKRWTDPTFVYVLNQTLKGIKVEILDSLMHFPEMILITNYEVWNKDITIHEKLIACGFDTIVLDEAHVLKSTSSRSSQRVRELIYAENRCPKCGSDRISMRLSRKICMACEHAAEKYSEFCSIKNVFQLTGTPVLNRPDELFALLNNIDRIGFPDITSFRQDYCARELDYRTQKYIYTFGEGGSQKLLTKLGMKYTARTRDTAGVTMPPQEMKHHWLELDPEKYPRQTKFINELRDRARLVFDEENQMTTDQIFAWYTRMRQAASWPDAIKILGCPHTPVCQDEWGNPAKCFAPTIVFPPPGAPPIGESIIMDKAEEIVAEAVEDGDRIIVFSWFRGAISELERRCQEAGLRVATITGDISDRERQTRIDDFNTNYTKVGEHLYDVLICQYKTASTGLNLNGAQQTLFIEREWNPGKEEQAADRTRRLDSKYETIVHLLHCEGTVTELIDAIHDQKKSMLEGFQADVDLAEAMRKFLEG